MSRYQWARPGIMILALWLGSPALAEFQSSGVVDFESTIRILETVPMGRQLTELAETRWGPAWAERLEWGPVSRTDAVLTRHWDSATGQEVRAREVTVILRQDQSKIEIVLDLAHELIHALHQPEWDPYDEDLHVRKYIEASINGEGGEANALATECRVWAELQLRSDRVLSEGKRCARYRRSVELEMDRERIESDFYRVGIWKAGLETKLREQGHSLPQISDREAVFFSSTGKLPYPVSLFQEFFELSKVACQNTENRLISLQNAKQPQNFYQTFIWSNQFLKKRCQYGTL